MANVVLAWCTRLHATDLERDERGTVIAYQVEIRR
jgi:hypothetical protein